MISNVMFDRGRVVKTEGNLAQVEFEAPPECTRCGACHRSAGGKMCIEAENLIGAGVGDWVEVEISPVVKVLVPFLVYGIPVIFLFAGLFLGNLISQASSIIIGLIFLGLGFVTVRWMSKRISGREEFLGRILRRL